MNNPNNDEKELNQQLNPRIIEIPVQHYTSPILTPNNNNINNNNNNNNLETNNQDTDFFNRPRLFEEFSSPFDLYDSPIRSRSLFNRDPLSSRFDDFFSRPSGLHQQPFPTKQSIFEDPYLNRNGISPSRDTILVQPQKERSNLINTNNTQPPLTTSSNTNINNNNTSNERNSPNFTSNTTNNRTESPKLSATVYQIPIQHIQTSSELPPPPPPGTSYINSDFKHQIPVKKSTDSPIRQTTPPTFKQPVVEQQQTQIQKIPLQPIPTPQQQQQQQQQQQIPQSKPNISTNPTHTSTAFINLDSDFKQPLNTAPPSSNNNNKIRSESPSRQVASAKPVNTNTNKQQQIPVESSDFKQTQPINNKIRAESPARQPTVIPLPPPPTPTTSTSTAATPSSSQPILTKQNTDNTSQSNNPLNKIRSESPARQPTVIPLPPPPQPSVQSKQNTDNTQSNNPLNKIRSESPARQPTVIPLPPPQQPQPQQQQFTNMGNTSNGQNSKKTAAASATPANNIDTTDNVQLPAAAPPPPQKLEKSAQEKCDDIACELENLNQSIIQFDGKNKNDKNYLKLDELLTRCFLKLDDIDKTDEKVRLSRRKLIDFTQQLVDKLEAKVMSPTEVKSIEETISSDLPSTLTQPSSTTIDTNEEINANNNNNSQNLVINESINLIDNKSNESIEATVK